MEAARTLTMSLKELDRLELLGRVIERRMTQRQAAAQLGLGVRQVERLCRALREQGASGLVSRKRGRPSNRTLPEGLREQVLSLVRAHYSDFGPTLACEKLAERDGIHVSRETPRLWNDRRRDLGSSCAAAPRLPTSAPEVVSGRADPDRRLRARLVRGPRSQVQPARLRGRRHQPVDGASFGGLGVCRRLLCSNQELSEEVRQARGVLQRQGQHLSRIFRIGPRVLE